MKYFLGLIVGLLPAIAIVGDAIALNSSAIAQSCANYWVNPKTRQQECLKVTYKPSFQYLGKVNTISKAGKKVTIKFYAEKNIVVTDGISKPLGQVTTFSSGYRFDNVLVLDCNKPAIAFKSEAVSFRGKLKVKDEHEILEFEPITSGIDARTYNYICNGVIPKD